MSPDTGLIGLGDWKHRSRTHDQVSLWALFGSKCLPAVASQRGQDHGESKDDVGARSASAGIPSPQFQRRIRQRSTENSPQVLSVWCHCGSFIGGIVYLSAVPSHDGERFVLAFPRVKAHGIVLEVHDVFPPLQIMIFFIHCQLICTLALSFVQNAYEQRRHLPDRT